MINIIKDYITRKDCNKISGRFDSELFNCSECTDKDVCVAIATNRCNSDFAESINYGGCRNEEEFWGQLFE